MGLFESLSAVFVRDVYAEEPQQDEPEGDDQGDDKPEGKEDGDEGGDDKEEGDDENDDEDDDDEDEEDEEEEEEEPEDIAPKIQEDCGNTPQCAPHKHEFQECSERVQRWNDADEDERKKLGPKEDCVEEFFEFTHCVTNCAAPKLFKQLK